MISVHDSKGLEIVSFFNPVTCDKDGEHNLTEFCQVNWTMITTVNQSQHFVDVLVESNFAEGRMEATSNNTADNLINHTIITTTTVPTDSCTYPGSGNWTIQLADNCIIDTQVNGDGSELDMRGIGTLIINALIDNFNPIGIYPIAGGIADVYCNGCF